MLHDFTPSARGFSSPAVADRRRGGPQAPRRQQHPARRAIRASYLKLPGASASGAFSAGVKECLTTELTGISGWLPLSGGLTSWRGRAHGTRTLSGRGHWSAHPSADRGLA